MVKRTRQVRRTSRSAVPFFKTVLVLMVAAGGYTAATSGAMGPVHGKPPEPRMAASLSFKGADPVITGSVKQVFHSATFSRSNIEAKVDRLIPEQPDVIEVANAFEAVRKEIRHERHQDFLIASLRNRATATGAPVKADGKTSSAALDAITQVASISPEPVVMPERLAYARANTDKDLFKRKPSELIDQKQLACLETAIYFEARGESYRGQVAVAQVVMNRVKHRLYPGTICGVVYQNQSWRNACQFSFACDGIPERVTEEGPWKQAQEIAARVIDEEVYLSEVANATHYHASYVRPRWAPRMNRLTKIGLHIFYRFKNGWTAG